MQVSYCHDKQRTMVLPPVLVMNMFSSLVPCTRLINACTMRARPRTNHRRYLRVFGTDATCCSGARRLKMFTLLFACARTNVRARVALSRACGNSPHCASDSIMHLHQPGQSAPHGPRQDPAAAAPHGTHWGEPLQFDDGDHYVAIHEPCQVK